MRRLAGLLLLLLSPFAAAQRTWVVDWLNRPGTDFTDIQSAVDAAASGDVVHVRDAGIPGPPPGTGGHAYPAPVIDGKSLTLIGDGPTTTWIGDPSSYSLTVQNLASDQVVKLLRFHLPGDATLTHFTFQNCQGDVLMQDVNFDGVPTFFLNTITNCRRVVISHCNTAYAAISATDSSLTIADCNITRPFHFWGLQFDTVKVTRSRLWLSGSYIEGFTGQGQYTGMRVAVDAWDSDLYIGAGVTMLGGLDTFNGVRVCMTDSNGLTVPRSRLHNDFGTQFNGNVQSSFIRDQRPMPTVSATVSNGTLRVDQWGGALRPKILGIGPLGPSIDLSLGTLCLDVGQANVWWVVTLGFPQFWSFPIPPSLPSGTWVGIQGAELEANGNLLASNLTFFGVW